MENTTTEKIELKNVPLTKEELEFAKERLKKKKKIAKLEQRRRNKEEYNKERDIQSQKGVLYTDEPPISGVKQYARKREKISKRDEKVFEYKLKSKNLQEHVRDANWQYNAIRTAENNLVETELIRNELLEGGIELDETDDVKSTAELTQDDILKHVDLVNQRKIFDLQLSKGPYKVQYNISGRHLLLGGKKGHLAAFNWRKFELTHEHEIDEQVRDICWMMDDSMYAVAQRHITYVYGEHGEEIHKCIDFNSVKFLTYLPYHFLLVGCTDKSDVIYKDISLGENVAQVRVGLETSCMRQNPYNAIICLGHLNGTVSMVTPRDEPNKPVVSMLCHKGPITQIAVDPTGNYLVTTCVDRTNKVWDIRKTYEAVSEVKTPMSIKTVDISQKGVVAFGYGNQVVTWKHVSKIHNEPYLVHQIPNGIVENVMFCPFEDTLAVGHSRGLSSILIPGSGEATFDSKLPNPFSKDKHLMDYNVRSLLDKIPYDMITLDPTLIGSTGQREKDYKYSKHVKIDPKLREKLKAVGVVEKKEQKRITDKNELRKAVERIHEEKKQQFRDKPWWEYKDGDPLERFKRKKKSEGGEEEDDEEESEEEERPRKRRKNFSKKRRQRV